MALLKLKGVKKIYQQGKIEVPALRGIDLTVERGKFTTVFGPSGSGKTTMLNMIGCLDKPTIGTIDFNGQEPDSNYCSYHCLCSFFLYIDGLHDRWND